MATAAPDVVPYPDEMVEAYRAAGYWSGLTIPEEFKETARRLPEAPALVTPERELTYAELDARSDRAAAGLRATGLEPGDRVLLQLANCEWAVVAWYALLKAGAVPICTLVHHRLHELGEISSQAEPTAHLVQADFPGHDLVALGIELAQRQPSLRMLLTIGGGDAARGEIRLEDLLDVDAEPLALPAPGAADDTLAVLQLSGGTTSLPKLIPRLHGEYWYNSRVWAEAYGLGPGTCVAHLLPVIHNAGIVCAVHAAHAVGGCVAISRPDASRFGDLAARAEITHILLVRPIAQLIESGGLRRALGCLRIALWADKKLTPEIRQQYETETCTIVQMFGMGEGMCLFTPPDAPPEVRHHTNGSPLSPHDEIKVLEPGTENQVPRGQPGELCCRGPYTIRGYYRAPERNREAFTSDGFYRTGDVVVEVQIAGKRWYSLEDRLKDLINRGGEKINAAEVEGLLMRHPAIQQAALVSMPDPRLGERACAFVVAVPGADVPDLAGLREFFEGLGVAKFKWPERIEVRPELPRTNVQKVDKKVLRTEIAEILERETVEIRHAS